MGGTFVIFVTQPFNSYKDKKEGYKRGIKYTTEVCEILTAFIHCQRFQIRKIRP